jgi:hypothetical protein
LDWIDDSDFDIVFKTTDTNTDNDKSITSFKSFLKSFINFLQLFEDFLNNHLNQISPHLYHKDFQEQIKNRENLSIFELIILYSEIFIFHQDKIVEFLYHKFTSKPPKPNSKPQITLGKSFQIQEEEKEKDLSFFNFDNLKFKFEMSLINSLGYSFLHFHYPDDKEINSSFPKIIQLDNLLTNIFFVDFSRPKSAEARIFSKNITQMNMPLTFFRFKKNIFGIFEQEFQEQLTKDFQKDIYDLFDFISLINPKIEIYAQFQSDSPLTLLLLIYGKIDNEEFILQKETIQEINKNGKSIKIQLSKSLLDRINNSYQVKHFLKLLPS